MFKHVSVAAVGGQTTTRYQYKFMIVDPMTKGLLTKQYKDHVGHMGLGSLVNV